jgi:toxin ParE1/3/4
MLRVRLSDQAESDLHEIACFIARNNRTAAENFIETCISTALSLGPFPLNGPVEEADKSGTLRRIVVGRFRNYLMFYRVGDQEVIVLRILHAARNRKQALEDTRDI